MCGAEIQTRPIQIKIEGAQLYVCPSCSKHGKRVQTPSPSKKISVDRKKKSAKRTSISKVPTSSSNKHRYYKRKQEKDLISNYGEIIRKARQTKNMKQKQVTAKTKISLPELQSIESGKIRPTDEQIDLIEKFFNIKITENVANVDPKEVKKRKSFQTLGDIVVIKKKKED